MQPLGPNAFGLALCNLLDQPKLLLPLEKRPSSAVTRDIAKPKIPPKTRDGDELDFSTLRERRPNSASKASVRARSAAKQTPSRGRVS